MIFLFLLSFMSVVSSAPVDKDSVQILKFENERYEHGEYSYKFETSDGTKKHELTLYDPIQKKFITRGEFSYIAPDGKTYKVIYWADESGFHAEGDHLPMQPKPAQGISFSPPPKTVPIPAITVPIPPIIVSKTLSTVSPPPKTVPIPARTVLPPPIPESIPQTTVPPPPITVTKPSSPKPTHRPAEVLRLLPQACIASLCG